MWQGRRRLRSRRLGLVAVAVALVLPGCARAPQQGVNVKPLTTELVFGVPEVDETAAPPNFTPPDDPFPVFEVPRRPTTRPVPRVEDPPPPSTACPEAEPTAFPKRVEGTVVPNRPTEGVHTWRVQGTQRIASGVVSLLGVVTRTVKNVRQVSQGLFRFDVEEQEIVFASKKLVTQTFEVRQSNDGVNPDGIFLRSIRVTAEGSTSNFNPDPPIMLLPIPVRIGANPVGVVGANAQEQMDTTGVDPTSQAALRHKGTVLNRFTVDACGEVVQGWFVNADQRFVNPRGETFNRNYNYMIATQYGGIIIWEHVERPCEAQGATSEEDRKADPKNQERCQPAGDLVFYARIGQITPSA